MCFLLAVIAGGVLLSPATSSCAVPTSCASRAEVARCLWKCTRSEGDDLVCLRMKCPLGTGITRRCC
ncbi:hypothetical protein Y032_0090g2398 [Ancylostoma ceylanicum]|uniref:Secreted protein n=1 Tax=Ancylostoma ceylanicum TaxID=53326 RepID=A0A016TN15_9BILA|nr:hypothetical protein Y032_0090g2398 [Ancylostoma ceylanicum]